MKKIYALLLLVAVSIASAQNSKIHNPLQLLNVPQGSASDSILVRGSNGIVKFIKKSNLLAGSGGGSAVPLQSVLDASPFATYNNGNSRVALLQDNGTGRFIGLQLGDNSNSFNHQYTQNAMGIGIQTSYNPSGKSGSMYIGEHETNFARLISTGSTLLVHNVIIPNPTSNCVMTFPTGKTGSQTVAMLSDVPPKLYKSYVALLSQSGTNAPVATVLENTLGTTITWVRDSQSTYRGVVGSPGNLFVTNKTVGFTTHNNMFYTLSFRVIDANNIEIKTNGPDSVLTNGSIEVRVYN
jgi:hypothetical protein